MSFWESLGLASSFFWSPLIVLLLMGFVLVLMLGVVISYWSSTTERVLAGIMAALIVLFGTALMLFFLSNGIGPLSWVPSP